MTEQVEYKLNVLVGRVRKVRMWLVTLAVLKVAAISLVFVSVFVGVYAWLDHRYHFNEIGRLISFFLLVAGVIYVLYRLTKILVSHISCSRAANYIESVRSFDQQLVTAIEYYEKKQDYPYSEALAEHLVLQVDRVTADFRFDSTIRKWLGWLLVAVIIFGLGMGFFYVYDNAVYFTSYVARLFKPLAVVEPLPATSLKPISGDIVVEPGADVTLSASIMGKVPEYGRLVISPIDPNGSEADPNARMAEESRIEPYYDEEKQAKFEQIRSFEEPGKYKYRFETDEVAGQWHDITVSSIPKIKRITADVSLGDNRYIRPYTKDVNDYSLEVAEGSFVTLTVETTEGLESISLKDIDGESVTKDLQGSNTFGHKFIADSQGFIEFELRGDKGIANKNIPPLQVTIKVDEPAKFKMISPEGDYLATNVASIPIEFEVSDDFGLSSLSLHTEFQGKEPQVMTIPIEKGVRKKYFSYTLELENYDLEVGDSILFYAKATDVSTSRSLQSRQTTSDMYFIEVRPYRQRWHQLKPKLPNEMQKQGLKSDSEPIQQLLTILEYTRAIVKKTWAIAAEEKLNDDSRSKLTSIDKDVKYCMDHLVLNRDAFYKEDAESTQKLNDILGFYDNSSKYLGWKKARQALGEEKKAYRDLRKFVMELDKALKQPQNGQLPKMRDMVKMEERVHVTRYDKEQMDWELERLAQKLEEAAEMQKRLQEDFENFLRQLEQKQEMTQNTTDEESWLSKEKPSPGNPCPVCGSEEPGGCQACSLKPTVEGAQKPQENSASENQSQSKDKDQAQEKGQGKGQGQQAMSQGQGKGQQAKGQGQGKSQGQGQGQGNGQSHAKTQGQGGGNNQGSKSSGNIAKTGERMKMLEARQNALREQVSKLKKSLGELAQKSDQQSPDSKAGQGKGQKEADKHIEEAIAQMNNFDSKLAQAYYKPETDKEKLLEAVDAMEKAGRELKLAQNALAQDYEMSEQQLLSDKAAEAAKVLLELAEDFEAGKIDLKEMLEMLKESERVLAILSQQQMSQTASNESAKGGHLGHGGGGGDANAGPYTKSGPYIGPSSDKVSGIAPAYTARSMAEKFWSIAIRAKKQQSQLIKYEPSDARFYELESKFFEDAAKYGQESEGK